MVFIGSGRRDDVARVVTWRKPEDPPFTYDNKIIAG
jgi:hypothetical protein